MTGIEMDLYSRRGLVFVLFVSDDLSFPPTQQERDELFHSVETTPLVVVSLRNQSLIGSLLWLRLFGDLTQRAEERGHRFVVNDVSHDVVEIVEELGLTPHLRVNQLDLIEKGIVSSEF